MTIHSARATNSSDKRKLRPVDESGLKAITTEKDLFVWLFRLLDRSNPQVPVSDELRTRANGFLGDMLQQGYIDAAPAFVEDILHGIDWSRRSADGKQCGFLLLEFLGALGQSMYAHRDDLTVPRNRTTEMMLWTARNLTSGLNYKDDGWRIVSSAKFEAKHHVHVNVRLPEIYADYVLWELWLDSGDED